MEAREGMISGVTVIGAKEPSNYHVGAKAENSTHVSGIMGLAGMMGLAVVVGKKKRGRPRKYGPDGAIARALSPMPILSPVPWATRDCSAENQVRGWPIGSENKQQHKVGLENLGCCNENYLIQLQPWAICIMEAAGSISNVTLRQPDSSGGTLTYEGRFNIVSLSGSFTPTEIGGSRFNRTGAMNISFSGRSLVRGCLEDCSGGGGG